MIEPMIAPISEDISSNGRIAFHPQNAPMAASNLKSP
jgi:hypothetical protein